MKQSAVRRSVFATGSALVLGLSAHPSEGAVIYTDIVDVEVENMFFALDVDGGIPDLIFMHYSVLGGDGQVDVVSRVTGFTGSVAVSPGAHVDRLTGGDIIDGSLTFAGPLLDQTLASNANLGAPFNGRFSFGEWYPGGGSTETDYIGFEVGGLFGWVRVSVAPYDPSSLSSLKVTILDYAIETDQGGGSIEIAGSPEPSVLGVLALGATGTMLRRRRTW